MEEIKVTINNSMEDYINFNFYVGEKYYKFKMQYTIFASIGLVSLIAGVYLGFNIALIIIGLFLLLFRYIHRAILKNSLKRLVKDSPNILTFGELTINEQEIIEITKITTTHIKWEDIYSLEEVNNRIYIFFSKIQAFIIDKTLISEQELNQIRQWNNKNT